MNLAQRVGAALSMLFGRNTNLQIIPRWMMQTPAQLPDIYMDFPRAYELVPDIYACVSLIQSTIANLPMEFYIEDGDDEVLIERTPGSITDVWARANPQETAANIQEQLSGSLDIAGNAYLFSETLGGPRPRELYVLPPTRVRPLLDNVGAARMFELNGGINAISLIPAERVVWIRNYTPDIVNSNGLGLSPLGALQQQYETQYDASRWQRQFFKKGGLVAGMYTTDKILDPAVKVQTIKDLKEQQRDIEHAMDPVLLIGGLKYERAGLTQGDMQFIENSQLTTEAILRVFHIPPAVFGIKRGGALGDDAADTDWLMYYEQCIEPRTKRIEGSLNEFLLPAFGPRVRCRFNFSKVRAFQEVVLNRAKSYVIATGAPVLTVEEARIDLGKPAEPQDGELLVPLNLMPASEAQAIRDEQANAGGTGSTSSDNGDEPAVDGNGEPDANAASRREYRRKIADRDLRRHEKQFRRGLTPFFSRQEERVVHRLREMGARSSISDQRVIDIEALLDDSEGDRELLRGLLRSVVDERGVEVLEEIGADAVFTAFNERANAYVQQRGARLVQHVNDTTRRQLKETLADGIANDETLNELVARVREVYSERRTGGAATIARTETASAYNFATLEAYDQAGIETKEWLTARDDVVREAHAELDGQVVPVNAPFVMTDSQGGVWEADYPGDPSLPPELSINCRCTLLPGTGRRSRKKLKRLPAKTFTLQEIITPASWNGSKR